jgi:hypothetical protein
VEVFHAIFIPSKRSHVPLASVPVIGTQCAVDVCQIGPGLNAWNRQSQGKTGQGQPTLGFSACHLVSTFLGNSCPRLKIENEARLTCLRKGGADNLPIIDAGQAFHPPQAKKRATGAWRKPPKRQRVAGLPEVQGKFL